MQFDISTHAHAFREIQSCNHSGTNERLITATDIETGEQMFINDAQAFAPDTPDQINVSENQTTVTTIGSC